MSVQTMQFCSIKQGTVSPWSTAPRSFRVFPTMSGCESWEHTASCSKDVVDGGGLGALLHDTKLHRVD